MSEINTKPQNDGEVLFISSLPYYAPRIAKQIAFLMDNGETKESILKLFPKADEMFLRMFDAFVDFYISDTERAREIFMPYTCADFSMSAY